MTEIAELVAVAKEHEPGASEACPFCPRDNSKKLKTYPGASNDSDVLEKIMEKPERLSELQSNAWPHDGKPHGARDDVEGSFVHSDFGIYEFQAHHLLSGNQALKGHKFEQWILSQHGKIVEDSGYSINGSLNGIWAPSWPKSFRSGSEKGKWTLDETDRQGIANHVMKITGCQFHLGAHNIGDPQDTGEVRHKRYDSWLKKRLSSMNRRMWGWTRKCGLCCEDGNRKDPPFEVNPLVNIYLNNLSASAKTQITRPRSEWFVFLSRLALEYHKEVCRHEMPVMDRKVM